MAANPFRIITTKQAKFLLGKSMRQTRRLMNAVRAYFKKELRMPITVGELCEYFKWDIEKVYKQLGWKF